jgi:hypothetical protein
MTLLKLFRKEPVHLAGLVSLMLALALFADLTFGTCRHAKASSEYQPLITEANVAAKNANVVQCYAQQAIPVMGFGPTVVCLKKEGVLWIR